MQEEKIFLKEYMIFLRRVFVVRRRDGNIKKKIMVISIEANFIFRVFLPFQRDNAMPAGALLRYIRNTTIEENDSWGREEANVVYHLTLINKLQQQQPSSAKNELNEFFKENDLHFYFLLAK